jgi:hypothetical protein
LADIVPGLAAKYGVPEWLVRGMVKQEGGANPDGSFRTSPAGAQGPAQLMPGTAKALSRRYGINTNTYAGNLEGGVAYLGEQLKRFKRPDLALSAYNSGPGGSESSGRVENFAETQKYVRNIMSGAKVGGGTAMSSPASVAPPVQSPAKGDARKAFAMNLLQALQAPKGERNQAMFSAITQLKKAQTTPTNQPVYPNPALSFPRGNEDPSWGGSHGIATGFAQIGLGNGLKAVSEKRSRMNTSTGGVSDHWDKNTNSYAYDLSNGSQPTPQMDQSAAQIAAQLGVKWNGGPLEITKVVNGYRVQVLYRTNTGGNHFDHIHVGVRRVG